MLNVDKIKLMTRLSLYEEKEKKKTMLINHYFKSDYISCHMIKSAVFFTVSCATGLLLYILYHAEDWISHIQDVDLVYLGTMSGILYLVCLSAYLILSYFVYDFRFDRAKKSLKGYHSGLKRLNHMYELSDRNRDTKREV